MLQKALIYLNRAVQIHPAYKNAYLLMGNCHYYLNDFEKSILAYEAALKIDPEFKDARNNLAVSYRDAARNAGERQRNITLAESLLLKSYSINPTDTETLRLLGVAYGMSGQHQKAITYFSKVVELDPKNAAAFLNLSSAYQYMGDTDNANKYRAIALQLDPNVAQKK
ncbi:MAG: tetratricopeptide repeat protein [Saprospiraceae bacterium]|nr:tetratricopeptide repeat protein [Saprospiraceae bacterium]